MLAALAGSSISQAAASTLQPVVADPQTSLEVVPQQSSPDGVPETPAADPAAPGPPADTATSETTPAHPLSLAALVDSQPQPGDLSRELNCLAGAIYFEAKSESLSGQLAVGRVIVARSKSGRFPNSYCGVVYQPSQFSFVRGGAMPAIPRGSQQWHNAVAIAQIAHAGSWHSPVEGALYFHAASSAPGWRLARVGRIENHIFFR